jgi:hypothetical protein
VHAESACFSDRPCRCGAKPLSSPCARQHLLQSDTLLLETHTAAVHLWSTVQRPLVSLRTPAPASERHSASGNTHSCSPPLVNCAAPPLPLEPACPRNSLSGVFKDSLGAPRPFLASEGSFSRSVFLVTSGVFPPGVRTFGSCFGQLALTETKLLVLKPARFLLLRAAGAENKVPTSPNLTCCARRECMLQ